jgi:hypothetical protein
MPDLISLEDFADELKQYAHDNKLHVIPKIVGPTIDEKTATGAAINQYASTYVTHDSVILTDRFVKSVLQPGNKKAFTPKDDVYGFKSVRAYVRPAKVDILIDEDERLRLWKTYLGMMYAGKFDPKSYPFEQFVTEDLEQQAREDVAVAIWHGSENPTGNEPIDVCDGYMKRINTFIADGTCGDPIEVTGGLTPENMKDVLEAGLKSHIPAKYRNHKNLTYISDPESVVTYRESVAKKYPTHAFNNEYGVNKLWGRNTGFTTVDHFVNPDDDLNPIQGFFTLTGNLAYLYDFDSSKAKLTADYSARDRSLAYVSDFQIGTGVAVPKLIWPVVKV